MIYRLSSHFMISTTPLVFFPSNSTARPPGQGADIKVLVKIESADSVPNLAAILEASDGVSLGTGGAILEASDGVSREAQGCREAPSQERRQRMALQWDGNRTPFRRACRFRSLLLPHAPSFLMEVQW